MIHFQPIASLDIWAFTASLYLQRVAFDAVTLRQDWPDSPHQDTRMILLRGPEGMDGLSPAAQVERWFQDVPQKDDVRLAEWPEARDLLDRAMEPLRRFCGRVRADDLGKVMVIELKPGGALGWHVDEGPYAADHRRFHLPLVTNPKAFLYAGGESAHLPAGVLTQFDHRVLHSAANFGETPRVHLIIDIRRP